MKWTFRKLLLLVILLQATVQAFSANATWIWYPGDYELWLGNNLQNRRTERGTFFPPFWKMDSHYSLVEFSTDLNLAEQETITICAEGRYNVKLDGKFYPGMSVEWKVNPGLAGIYNLRFRYRNVTEKALTLRLQVIAADDRLLKDGPITFPPASDKWKVISTTTEVFINAGVYRIRLSSDDAAGLWLDAMDVQ